MTGTTPGATFPPAASGPTPNRPFARAHQQYGKQHEKWNDKLEVKLSTEWDEEKTGQPFSAVRPFVRHGWNALPQDGLDEPSRRAKRFTSPVPTFAASEAQKLR